VILTLWYANAYRERLALPDRYRRADCQRVAIAREAGAWTEEREDPHQADGGVLVGVARSLSDTRVCSDG